jgi:hypothetical protein
MSSQAQHILQSHYEASGSFSGFRNTAYTLGSGYLSAQRTREQPLCGNKEGWGPISRDRYDFTPCFMDIWVSTVAVFGIFAGLIAVWWLVRRKTKGEVVKNWHFWTKQVGFLNSVELEDWKLYYPLYLWFL